MTVFYPGVIFANKRYATVETTKAGGKNTMKVKALEVKVGTSMAEFMQKLKGVVWEEKRIEIDNHFVDIILGDRVCFPLILD